MAGVFRPTEAERILQAYKAGMNSQPTPHSFASTNPIRKERWASPREVVVSADLAQERPREVDFEFLDAIVRLGCKSHHLFCSQYGVVI